MHIEKCLRENARKWVLDQIVAVKKYIDTLSIVKTHTARIIKSSLEAPKLQRAKKEIRVGQLTLCSSGEVQGSGKPSKVSKTIKSRSQ